MERGDIYYYARCLPHANEFEVLTLSIRTVTDRYFIALDNLNEKSSMQAYAFFQKDLNEKVFKDYEEALKTTKENKRRCSK